MDYQTKEKFVIRTFPNDEYGCEYDGYEHEKEQIYEKSHIAFLFKRGNCPYVTKALNARRAGAAMTIVYLDSQDENARNIIPIAPKNMADNVPPVVVINYEDGVQLKTALNSEKDLVRINVDFDVEKKTDTKKVVNIWLSPMNSHSYDFLHDFSKYYKYFWDIVDLKILFRVKEMGEVIRNTDKKSNKNDKKSKEKKDGELIVNEWKFKNENIDYTVEDVLKSCYGKGKFCALSDAKRLTNPTESLDEAIVQSCLWEHAQVDISVNENINLMKGNKHVRASRYMAFARSFNKKCLKPFLELSNSTRMVTTPVSSISECSASLRMKNFYMPENKLKSCIDSKFADSSNKFESESEFLSNMKENTNFLGNYDIVPSMLIDGNLVRGKLNGHTAISAICDSFKTKPHVCFKIHEYLNQEINSNY